MRTLLRYIICICFFSCNTPAPKDSHAFKTLVTDTALHQFDVLEFCKFRSKLLNLQQIHNGVDSFELRIWNFGIWTPKQVVILRYFDNKWVTCDYSYLENGKQVIDSLMVKCKQIDPIVAENI